LIAGEMLSVKISRPETGYFVHSRYSYDPEEVEAVFNSFLGVRVQYEAQRWAKPGNKLLPLKTLFTSLNLCAIFSSHQTSLLSAFALSLH